MDAAAAPRCLLRDLNELKDPRVERTKHHSLNDIPIITILAVMKCRREVIGGGSGCGSGGGIERRYYISSMAGDDAKQMLAAACDHWGGENKVHWSLDVSFREDECRIRTGHGAENFAWLRRLSINLLKAETTAKVGLASKRLRCGRDHDHLLKILAGTKNQMSSPCKGLAVDLLRL